MNKELLVRRFSKAVDTYDSEAIVQKNIAFKMTHLLKEYVDSCRNIFEFGCGTGIYSRMLLAEFSPERLTLNDICPQMNACFPDMLNERVTFYSGDAERISLPHDQSLITSCSTIQWFISPGVFFKRCNDALSDGGYLAFSTFGKENMKEITSVTGKGLFYHSRKEMEELISADYELVHSEEETIELTFQSPMGVLYHLKQTGVTAVGEGKMWTRRDVKEFCKQYSSKFGNGYTVALTYHPIYIIAKKK